MAPDFSDSSTQNASFTCQNLRMGRLARKDFAGFDPWDPSGPPPAQLPPAGPPTVPRPPQSAPRPPHGCPRPTPSAPQKVLNIYKLPINRTAAVMLIN